MCEPTAVCELLNLVPLVKIVIASQSSRQGTLAKNPLRSWCFWQTFCVSKIPVSDTGLDKITANALYSPRTVPCPTEHSGMPFLVK